MDRDFIQFDIEKRRVGKEEEKVPGSSQFRVLEYVTKVRRLKNYKFKILLRQVRNALEQSRVLFYTILS